LQRSISSNAPVVWYVQCVSMSTIIPTVAIHSASSMSEAWTASTEATSSTPLWPLAGLLVILMLLSRSPNKTPQKLHAEA